MKRYNLKDGKELIIASAEWIIEDRDLNWVANAAIISSNNIFSVSEEHLKFIILIMFDHGVRNFVFVGKKSEIFHDKADDIVIESAHSEDFVTVFFGEDDLEEAIIFVTELAFVGVGSRRGILAVLDPNVSFDSSVRKSLLSAYGVK